MDALKIVEYVILTIGTLSAICTAIGSITALPEGWRKIALLIGSDLSSVLGVMRGKRPSSVSQVAIYTVDEYGKIKPDTDKH